MPRFDSLRQSENRAGARRHVTSTPVVVRLDDSGASGFIDELDEMLAADCVHELVIHGFAQTTKREAFDKAQTTAGRSW